jgi:hypothetical protein
MKKLDKMREVQGGKWEKVCQHAFNNIAGNLQWFGVPTFLYCQFPFPSIHKGLIRREAMCCSPCSFSQWLVQDKKNDPKTWVNILKNKSFTTINKWPIG